MDTIFILAAVFAVAATVCAFIFVVPEKSGKNKFLQVLSDILNFKTLFIEKFMQALYILATAYVILFGFFMLFYVQEGYSGYYYSRPAQWYGGYGLLLMIVGPIAIRLVYEVIMMSILLVKNVIQINGKLKNQNDDSSVRDMFAVPKIERKAPVQPAAPVQNNVPMQPAAFCTECGSRTNPDGTCPNCGK